MFGQELEPPTKQQKEEIEKAGIDPTSIDSKGKADELIKRIHERNQNNLSTAKQIRQLEQRGYQNVANWSFDQARVLINQLAANNWRTVHSKPQIYTELGGAKMNELQKENEYLKQRIECLELIIEINQETLSKALDVNSKLLDWLKENVKN